MRTAVRYTVVLQLAAAGGFAGCSEPAAPIAPTERTTMEVDRARRGEMADRRATVASQVARGLAMALDDAGLRIAVGQDIRRSSATRELKVEAGGFLTAPGQRALLVRAANSLGIDTDSLATLVRTLGSMELYMPVRAHRASWRGEDVLVASQIRKDDPITAFDGRGQMVELALESPPNVPTFALVPSEADFASLRPGTISVAGKLYSLGTHAGGYQVSSCDPTVILETCADSSWQGGNVTIPATAPSGIYMVYSELYDAAEPWIRGDPEIEVHVLGPSPADPASAVRPVSCSGAQQSGAYYFDQNSNVWTGAVMVLSEAQVINNGFVAGNVDNRAMSVLLYEDDDQACVIKDDPNRVLWDLGAAASFAVGGVWIASDCRYRPCGLVTLGAFWLSSVGFIVQAVETNDDYLGVAVVRSSFPAFNSTTATHALVKHDNALNGGVRLIYHNYGTAD